VTDEAVTEAAKDPEPEPETETVIEAPPVKKKKEPWYRKWNPLW
jgi:hypothetical protein